MECIQLRRPEVYIKKLLTRASGMVSLHGCDLKSWQFQLMRTCLMNVAYGKEMMIKRLIDTKSAPL